MKNLSVLTNIGIPCIFRSIISENPIWSKRTKLQQHKNKKNSVDETNPFHLHSSDHPRATLLTKALNGDNYATLSRSMSLALSIKNKTGFVDVAIQKPVQTNKKFASWKHCNGMVLSWILNSIDSSLRDSVIYTIDPSLRERDFLRTMLQEFFRLNKT